MSILNFIISEIIFKPVTTTVVTGFVGIIILLLSSAFVSGSEVAFFSINKTLLKKGQLKNSRNGNIVISLLSEPEKLLATILIANNFINIGIIMLSAYITEMFVDFSGSPRLGFFIQIVGITFLLLLFGEIIPKVYAAHANIRFAKFMALPLLITSKIFYPVSILLIKSTSIVNKRYRKHVSEQNISPDDLSHALKLTQTGIDEDKDILEGIVSFANTDVNEIIKPRIDLVAVDNSLLFNEILDTIRKSGLSRIPVYEKTLDNIKGILYAKDLLEHINEKDDYNWQKHIREPYFVPETGKINDLLREFQTNNNHIAIVTDEYGGVSGIVTLEDILEEVFGEISDESDEENNLYKKIDTNTYIFEAKILLNDVCKVIDTDDDFFDTARGDADSLGGLMLEMKGEIPEKGEILSYKNLSFLIISADKRKITKIKLTVS